MGSTKVVDVFLEYELKRKDGTVVFEKRETVAVQTRAGKSLKIPLTSDAIPGRYDLSVVAHYADQIADARTSLIIIERPAGQTVQAPPVVVEEPEVEAPGPDQPVSSPTEPEIPSADVTIEAETYKEVASQVEALARNSPSKALGICDALQEVREKDKCYEALGQELLRPRICNRISNAAVRDKCLWTVVVGSGNVDCAELSSEQLQRSCESFKGLSTI